MEFCQLSLVTRHTFLGWPLRIATVARQVFLCVGNGGTHRQPPRGLHPEWNRSALAATQGHASPAAHSVGPRVLDQLLPRSRAVTGQALARHYQHFRQSPCSQPTHVPSLLACRHHHRWPADLRTRTCPPSLTRPEVSCPSSGDIPLAS